MRGLRFTHVATAAAALLSTLVCAASASAQAPPAGLGDRLFSTGGDITVEVRRPRPA
jgi:hypothetical protein